MFGKKKQKNTTIEKKSLKPKKPKKIWKKHEVQKDQKTK